MIKQLTGIDLSRAMFNIKDIKEGADIIKMFPRIAQYEEFSVPLPSYLDRAVLFRYIVLMYDSQLAVRELIADLGKRKRECAVLAGFPEKDGKFDDLVETMLLNMNPSVNNMIIAYCQMQRMPKFTSLVAIEEAHFKLLKKLLDEGTDKSSVLKTINEMEYEMEERRLELLNYDKSFYLYNSLYEKTEMERLELRPEHIADKLKKGQEIVDVHPYGKKYKKETYTREDVKKGRKSPIMK
jgi:hypothetical protein